MDDRAVREKLVHHGVAALSEAELLSVLLGGGGERLAEHGLALLAGMDFRSLRMLDGLGAVRAAALAVAFELGRRVGEADGNGRGPVCIRSEEDVLDIFRPLMTLPHEEFWVLYLSGANTVLGKERVGQGGVSEVAVDHRLVVKRAVELLASAMVLVHNHPSGVAVASEEDKALTARIADAARLFDIQIMDHLVLAAGDCFSFRRAGLVK